MTWIQTYTKKKFDLLNPKPEMVCIEDVAHSLSNNCRFNGHPDCHYSVAQHSILVSELVKPENALWALLHDAGETYYGDITSPMKEAYKKLEVWNPIQKMIRHIDWCVYVHFCLITKRSYWEYEADKRMPREVKVSDLIMLATEKRDLMDGLGQVLKWDGTWNDGIGVPMKKKIEPWSQEKAESMFLERFEELS